MSALPGARGTVGGGKGEYQGEGNNGEKGTDGMTANTYTVHQCYLRLLIQSKTVTTLFEVVDTVCYY